MFKKKQAKPTTKTVEPAVIADPVDLMDALTLSAESEYHAILQRWIDTKSLTDDPERMRICCEQLKIPLQSVSRDKEVLLKAKALLPEIAKKDENYAKFESYSGAWEKRKKICDDYCRAEYEELSKLNVLWIEHSSAWNRALDAERQLRELKEKYPRAFGQKPEELKVTEQL